MARHRTSRRSNAPGVRRIGSQRARTMDDVVPNQATLQRGSREVLKDPVLGTRVRSRACYRDKSQGQSELRAKTRVVVLGHRDPNLTVINREAPIPTRLTEQVLLTVYMSGRNRKLLQNERLWRLVRRRRRRRTVPARPTGSGRTAKSTLHDATPWPKPVTSRYMSSRNVREGTSMASRTPQDYGRWRWERALWPRRSCRLYRSSFCSVRGWLPGDLCGDLRPRHHYWIAPMGKHDHGQRRQRKILRTTYRDVPINKESSGAHWPYIEASAADGAIDRGVFANQMFSQIVFGAKANPLTNLKTLRHCHATDCKSLYDAAIAANFNTEEKRVGLTIRAVQETIPPSDMRWVPTIAMGPCGLMELRKQTTAFERCSWTGYGIQRPNGWGLRRGSRWWLVAWSPTGSGTALSPTQQRPWHDFWANKKLGVSVCHVSLCTVFIHGQH